MNSAGVVWERVLSILSEKLTSIAVDTWFSDAEAVRIDEGRLVLYFPSTFKREVVETRFTPALKEVLFDLFSGEMDLLILGEGELDSFLSDGDKSCCPRSECHNNLTFARFIVGSNNKFAHAAAVAVAEQLGSAYNPLFIYGSSGLGKTHLLYAICHAVRQKNADIDIVYIKGEEFTNELINAIQSGNTEEFRTKYRSADLFLVDDIQFIAGKEQTQEEFFHTFNALYESGCQIVLTSDRPPKEILLLEDRLKSRFEWGLLADIKPPDYETRIAIIKSKAMQLGLTPPQDVTTFLAQKITNNVRQLEGAVKKLTAYRDLLGSSVDQAAAFRAIEDILKSEFLPTPEVIIQETARYYRLTPEDLRGSGRTRDTALARQVSMYLIRQLTELSLVEIGKEYKGKSGRGMDHSSVLSSIEKIKNLVKDKPAFGDILRDIQNNITERS